MLTIVKFMGWTWPEDSMAILQLLIGDVLAFRASLVESGAAPKTISWRISSLSSFYKYLGGAAAELRLPTLFRIRRTRSSSPGVQATR